MFSYLKALGGFCSVGLPGAIIVFNEMSNQDRETYHINCSWSVNKIDRGNLTLF